MKTITLAKPIALTLTRGHLPESDPARQFTTHTAVIYVEDRFTETDDGMIQVIATAYLPKDSKSGTPYDLTQLGGTQALNFRKSLIQAITPA